VREELGPDASVLHTREIGSPLLRFLGGRLIEVTASAELTAPSRLPQSPMVPPCQIPAAELQDFRHAFRQNLLIAQTTERSQRALSLRVGMPAVLSLRLI
jgi:hypothetical protein